MRSTLGLSGLLIVAIVAGGCAHSDDGGGGGKCVGATCDMKTGPHDLRLGPDMTALDMTDPNFGKDFSVETDMTMLLTFGQPCSDPAQCADDICVLAGITGFCSKQCSDAADCPTNFGCYGVLGGGVDPNLVVNICIPNSTLLCTQCADPTECSATGRDLCLPSPSGAKFCSRDCSTVSCPSGYNCNDVMVAGQPFKQCVPTSGACDCLVGATGVDPIACTITTPLGNACPGALMCTVDKGWSACTAASDVDTLDDFVDNNCDGVDGIASDAVFVATTGTNADGCGFTFDQPCRTITYGSQVASTFGRHYVYVQGGYYAETVVLVAGINIVGGFDTNWVHAARTITGHDVYITGSAWNDTTTNRTVYVSVVAHNVATETKLIDLYVVGPDATSAPAGTSSFGIHSNNSKLTLTRVTINGGNGAAGTNGLSGTNAPSTSAATAMNGVKGGDAHNHSSCCDDSDGQRVVGGSGGSNSCEGVNTGGGQGGDGGKVDTSCSCKALVFCSGNCTASPGWLGFSAPAGAFYVGGTLYSYGGAPGANNDHGTIGYVGYAKNGTGGGGGNNGVLLSGQYWSPNSGVDGLLGNQGTGGGGGGGGGGCDSDTDDDGARGGGGGAGGCRATGFGKKGTGGGGSFGIVSIATTLNITADCKISRGIGGKGGTGGNGAQGQSGGSGFPGGGTTGDTCSTISGGPGANGGHGGHAGAGGGGAGGACYGVFQTSTSTITGSCTVSGGAPGQGGGGGLTVGIGDSDGNPAGSGGSGGTGNAAATYTCTNVNGC